MGRVRRKKKQQAQNNAEEALQQKIELWCDRVRDTINLQVVLHVEIVDFDGLIFDSNDLSTVRGGSMLALAAVSHLATVLEVAAQKDGLSVLRTRSGASTLAMAFELERGRADARAANSALSDLDSLSRQLCKSLENAIAQYFAQTDAKGLISGFEKGLNLSALRYRFGLSGSHDFSPSAATAFESAAKRAVRKNENESLKLAYEFLEQLAHNRFVRSRFTGTSVYVNPSDDFGPIDNITPCRITSNRIAKKGKTTEDHNLVNAFARQRRSLGRDQRDNFYLRQLEEQLGDLDDEFVLTPLSSLDRALGEVSFGELKHWLKGVRFSQSFDQIAVAQSPAGLRHNLVGKLGLVYADGNSFSALFREVLDDREKSAAYSKNLKQGQALLLAHVLAWVMLEPEMSWTDTDGETIVRLETLLWGGDEYLFVVPSWHALDLMQVMQEQFKNFRLAGRPQPLTHASGLLIAPHKVPIRLLTEAAKALGDAAKSEVDGRNRNAFQLFVAEGMDLFANAIEAQRAAHFGLGGAQSMDANLFGLMPPPKAMDKQKLAQEEVRTKFTSWRRQTADVTKAAGQNHLHQLLNKILELNSLQTQQAAISNDHNARTRILELLTNELQRVGKSEEFKKYILNERRLYSDDPSATLIPLLTALMVADYIDPFAQIASEPAQSDLVGAEK